VSDHQKSTIISVINVSTLSSTVIPCFYIIIIIITSHTLQERPCTANSTQKLCDSPKLLVKYIHCHVMQSSCRRWKKNSHDILCKTAILRLPIKILFTKCYQQCFKYRNRFHCYHKAVTYSHKHKNLLSSDK